MRASFNLVHMWQQSNHINPNINHSDSIKREFFTFLHLHENTLSKHLLWDCPYSLRYDPELRRAESQPSSFTLTALCTCHYKPCQSTPAEHILHTLKLTWTVLARLTLTFSHHADNGILSHTNTGTKTFTHLKGKYAFVHIGVAVKSHRSILN